ncbi:hypothetical protein [Brevibacillus migulae]|uniref:hypothetical protein n=1 Tax=Brevibacillus migulae TaxID=1644114 RepID=UPI001F3A8A46|nr:hypothetical protein [Brevibacillus migulae]
MSQQRGIRRDGQKKQIVEMIQRIQNLTDTDEPQAVRELIAILNELLRIKNTVPPTVEIMSYIKHATPKLYHATRMGITSTSNLNLLFQLEADPALAQERLKEYLQS